MNIALIHQGKSYLPELWAYHHFLKNNGHVVFEFINPTSKDLNSIDVEWHFMGNHVSFHSTKRIIIHEYVSPSTPPYAHLKDWLKKRITSRPDLRIFGNSIVKQKFDMNDGVPFLYRDAGVAEFFFIERKNENPEYDFVYCGAMDKTRKINLLLESFLNNFKNSQLLLIGPKPINLSLPIANHPALYFTGKISYTQVPTWLNKAKYALNFIPNEYPYRHQRPLKLLEYCAMKLPIITTGYEWINEFEKSRNANFFKLKPDLSNFNPQSINNFDFQTPDVSDLKWEKIFNKSGILEFLRQ